VSNALDLPTQSSEISILQFHIRQPVLGDEARRVLGPGLAQANPAPQVPVALKA